MSSSVIANVPAQQQGFKWGVIYDRVVSGCRLLLALYELCERHFAHHA